MSVQKLLKSLVVLMALLCTGCTNNVGNYYTGTVENDLYNIESEIAGKLDELYVQEGQIVKKNDKLLRINIEELKDNYNSLVAQVDGAKSKFDLISSGNRIEELNKIRIQISTADELIDTAKKSMEKALDDYNINETLFSKNAATLQMVKDSKHIYELGKSKYESSLKEKKVFEEQLQLLKKGNKTEEIDYYENQLKSISWTLKAMEKQLEKEYIYAPSDGVVENILIKEGELLNFGSKAMKISDTKNMWVNIYIEESKLSNISIDDELMMKRDNGEESIGRVFFISSIGEFTPKNLESKESKQEVVFLCKIKILDIDKFKPGMLIDVYLEEKDNE